MVSRRRLCCGNDSSTPIARTAGAEPAGSQTDASPGTVSLDWIAPGPQQDQGALSAAARIDALSRLKALARALPPRSDQRTQAVVSEPAAHSAQLRVAHGVPVGDYLGTSIEWRNAPPGRWRAWLLMVEELPAGTAGSPIARGLVRNSLQLDWTVPRSNGAAKPVVLSELRPMQIPVGAQADRLAVVGMVESVGPDPSGAPLALAAIARSVCEDHPPRD